MYYLCEGYALHGWNMALKGLGKQASFRHPGEGEALLFLERCGHVLLAHNFYSQHCELDLITLDRCAVLHCVEVKSWKSARMLQHPLAVFSKTKITHIRCAMLEFIKKAQQLGEEQGRALHIAPNIAFPRDLHKLNISFDLLWIRERNCIEYYPALF